MTNTALPNGFQFFFFKAEKEAGTEKSIPVVYIVFQSAYKPMESCLIKDCCNNRCLIIKQQDYLNMDFQNLGLEWYKLFVKNF